MDILRITARGHPLLRTLTIICAIAIIIIGAITFPLPIPIGLLLMAIGLAMLIGASKLARVIIKKLRKRYQNIDHIMLKTQQLAPKIIREMLQRTDPHRKRRASDVGYEKR